MQRYFSAEQFNIQADVLLNQGDVGLVPRVMHRDISFDFDQLEQRREKLVASWSTVNKQLDARHDPGTRQMPEARERKLEDMIQRITESFV